MMTHNEVTCVVEGLSQSYANGLERVELYVYSQDDIASVEKPRPKERITITFSTAHGDYEGGLRNNLDQYPYVCPDLRSKADDTKASLAQILKDNGFKPGDRLRVRIDGRTWTLLGSA
jgi:hypothetical protein